jgi:hypothetical protein
MIKLWQLNCWHTPMKSRYLWSGSMTEVYENLWNLLKDNISTWRQLYEPELDLQNGWKNLKWGPEVLIMSVIDGHRLQYYLRLRCQSITVPKTTEVLVVVVVIMIMIMIMIIYKYCAFWPIPIPELVELVPASLQWSASLPSPFLVVNNFRGIWSVDIL